MLYLIELDTMSDSINELHRLYPLGDTNPSNQVSVSGGRSALSPSMLETPAYHSVYGSPAQSPALQFFTPATAVAREGAAASPSWISPVPLESWNAINDHLQHLRHELTVRTYWCHLLKHAMLVTPLQMEILWQLCKSILPSSCISCSR